MQQTGKYRQSANENNTEAAEEVDRLDEKAVEELHDDQVEQDLKHSLEPVFRLAEARGWCRTGISVILRPASSHRSG